MRKLIIIGCVVFASRVEAQQEDSTEFPLQRISFRKADSSISRALSSETTIDRNSLDRQSPYSLVPAINSVPGARMEERSPGSYRLSIRGSLLRSPFGIRNVKIYLTEFPFTDAGGNTYLNSLDISNLEKLVVLKGPESSIFGANTGGVLLIDPVRKPRDSSMASLNISGGSYGLAAQDAWFRVGSTKSVLTVNQGYLRSGGYRENSAMSRHYLQLSEDWNYCKKASLQVLALFSDLDYQTPGGLTLAQFGDDPAQARPATATLPGAAEQKAAVSNRTVFGGISHKAFISKRIRHVFSVFGSGTEFENPFITNYERRTERSYGMRTYLDYKRTRSDYLRYSLSIGAEWQQTNAGIDNNGNNRGMADTLQASDVLKARQGFIFGRFFYELLDGIAAELSVSYNFFNYRYRNVYPSPAFFSKKKFDMQEMLRAAFSYKLSPNSVLRLSVSQGFSSPTIAEVRPSDKVINTSLQAETGENIETGFRVKDNRQIIEFDICAFYYRLRNAIVRRLDTSGNEYFINAGGTRQPGLESQLDIHALKPRKAGLIRFIDIKANMALYNFRFSDYSVNNTSYSGNKLTGVPDLTSVESLHIGFPHELSLFTQYYYVKDIPLNDANSAFAAEYHIVQVKAQWKKTLGRIGLVLFAGIDNLLDRKYSLGNDLNAAGSRYYNAAPPRNYYGGLKVVL
jgi:iron complex outermembrane receptor protein